jgi:predicted outer membrane protein
MKMQKHLTSLLIALLFVMACHEPSRNNRDKAASSGASGAVDPRTRSKAYTADVDLNGDEKIFLTVVLTNNLYAAEISGLVPSQTANLKLRAIAAAIVAETPKVKTNLHDIAQGKGLLLDEVLSNQEQQQIEDIKKLKNKAFDRQYLTSMMERYTTIIQQLNKVKKFKDKNIVVFATQFLPTATARYTALAKQVQTMAVQQANNGDNGSNASTSH